MKLLPALLAALGLAATPLWAQYKVVAPDGSVTYTDRPPVQSNLRITPMGRNAASPAAGAEVGLPFELRQTVSRFPVTIYTTTDCPPCDDGRKLLQQRGIPHAERSVSSDDDGQALERLVGGRTVPSLTVGAQPLRGFNEADWNGYLDAAGYPKASRLPRNWPAAVVAPLVTRAGPAGAGNVAAPDVRPTDAPAQVPPQVPPLVPAPSGPRF